MSKFLRILIIEDSDDDAFLVLRHIKGAGYTVESERVETALSFARALEQREWDLIIADYNVPGFNGWASLKLFMEKKIDIPFIIVSGTISKDAVTEMMNAGAHAYVMKQSLVPLIPTIERELLEAEVRREGKKLKCGEK